MSVSSSRGASLRSFTRAAAEFRTLLSSEKYNTHNVYALNSFRIVRTHLNSLE